MNWTSKFNNKTPIQYLNLEFFHINIMINNYKKYNIKVTLRLIEWEDFFLFIKLKDIFKPPLIFKKKKLQIQNWGHITSPFQRYNWSNVLQSHSFFMHEWKLITARERKRYPAKYGKLMK